MKKIIYTGLVVVWMVTIFMFSHQTGTQSNNSSGSVTNVIISTIKLITPLEHEQAMKITNIITPIIRKLAHFTIYLIGGILTYCTYNSYKKVEKKDLKYIWLFCVVYAISDEFHQWFIPGRSSELRDVIIDSVGAGIGIIIINIICDRRRASSEKSVQNNKKNY